MHGERKNASLSYTQHKAALRASVFRQPVNKRNAEERSVSYERSGSQLSLAVEGLRDASDSDTKVYSQLRSPIWMCFNLRESMCLGVTEWETRASKYIKIIYILASK